MHGRMISWCATSQNMLSMAALCKGIGASRWSLMETPCVCSWRCSRLTHSWSAHLCMCSICSSALAMKVHRFCNTHALPNARTVCPKKLPCPCETLQDMLAFEERRHDVVSEARFSCFGPHQDRWACRGRLPECTAYRTNWVLAVI